MMSPAKDDSRSIWDTLASVCIVEKNGAAAATQRSCHSGMTRGTTQRTHGFDPASQLSTDMNIRNPNPLITIQTCKKFI